MDEILCKHLIRQLRGVAVNTARLMTRMFGKPYLGRDGESMALS